MTRPVYIAGPYAGDIERNVRRACALSRLALAYDLAPVCVHPGIAAGAYGDDADPVEREAGLAAAVRLVRAVVETEGRLWVLLRDDGTMSSGTEREVVAWGRREHRAQTWAEWRANFEARGLLDLWERAS